MSRLSFALLLALAALPAHAARYQYQGDLMDGAAPARGDYDLRVRAFAGRDGRRPLGEATEYPAVRVVDGSFALDLDLPDSPLGETFVELEVRKSGSDEAWEKLGAPQPVAKVNTGCWALDGNTGVPATGFLGFPPSEQRALVLRAFDGVAINADSVEDSATDLQVSPKAGGDDDVDLALRTEAGKFARIYIREDGGNLVIVPHGRIEYGDGLGSSEQNDGQAVHEFSGRLRVRAAGFGVADTSGGVWLDDERGNAAFMGRGDNQSNWTGIYESTGGWRFAVHDNGAFGFNTGIEALPANVFKVNAAAGAAFNGAPASATTELTLRPTAPGTDVALSLAADASHAGRLTQYPEGLLALMAGNGDLLIGSLQFGAHVRTNQAFGVLREPAVNALEVEGNASKTAAGDWAANSDARIKRDIAPVRGALDTLMRLRPVTFRYSDDYRAAHPSLQDRRYYNVIAQEFAEVFPEAVQGSGEYLPGKSHQREHEILQVDTYPAQVTAIAAIQELAVQNDELRERLDTAQRENAELQRDLERLLARVERLEARGGR